jgi:hypothetical protein
MKIPNQVFKTITANAEVIPTKILDKNINFSVSMVGPTAMIALV